MPLGTKRNSRFLSPNVLAFSVLLCLLAGCNQKPQTRQVAVNPPADHSVLVSNPFEVEQGGYVPSGWMGDGQQGNENVTVDTGCTDSPHSPPTCSRWTYVPGTMSWVAIAWQYPEINWGGSPGKDLRAGQFTKVSFWARGRKGGEIVQFKAGGNTDPSRSHQASFEVTGEFVTLTPKRNVENGGGGEGRW